MRSTGTTPPERGTGVGRRGLIAAAVGTAALVGSACSVKNPFLTTKAPVASSAEVAADVALAVSAVHLLRDADARGRYAVATWPALAPRLAGLLSLHEAHLRALEAALTHPINPETPAATAKRPVSASAALAELRTAEVVVHDQLRSLALRAGSGPFARLLASMSAAVSQQLVVIAR